MKQRFAKFMYGRYGMDQFSRFLSFVALFLLIISMFMPDAFKNFLFIVALLAIAYSYYRTFSKKLELRRTENRWYMGFRNRITNWFKLRKEMSQQKKDFKFFKCPSCKAMLRVPKGKGKIRIVCKKCGTAFEKKT